MHNDKPKPTAPESLKKGYEVTDANTHMLAWVGVGLAVGTIAMVLLVVVTYSVFVKQSPGIDSGPVGPVALPEGTPAIQPAPEVDLVAHRAAEAQRLTSYGWVDREAGIAHIPIEQAKALVLEHGLPTFAPGTQERQP